MERLIAKFVPANEVKLSKSNDESFFDENAAKGTTNEYQWSFVFLSKE